MGILPQQSALPLRPQPDRTAEGEGAADQGIDKPGHQKMHAIHRQKLERIHRRHRHTHHRQPVVFPQHRVRYQRNHQHTQQRDALGQLQFQQGSGDQQSRQRAERTVLNAHAGSVITVLTDQHDGQQNPVRFRQIEEQPEAAA